MSQTPAAETPPVHRDLKLPKRRRWRAWLALLALLAAGAAGASLLWPRPPTVSALVRVPARHELAGVRALDASNLTGGPDLASHQRNQIALVRSQTVLKNALATPEVAKLPIVVEKGTDTPSSGWRRR